MEERQDLIDRQAAIDAFNTDIDELIVGGKGNAEAVEKYLNGVIGRIKELPSAQPEQRWIPCSERLPEPMGWDKNYLVSLAWGGVGAMEYKSTGFHNYGSFSPVPIETVTAWMPLPEPYRGEGERK